MTVISALLERGYSDDPLGLFMGVSAGGLAAWLVIFAIWKIASGLFEPQLERLMKLKRYEPNRLQINKKRYYVSENLPNIDTGIVLPSVTTVASATAPIGKTMALINWRKESATSRQIPVLATPWSGEIGFTASLRINSMGGHRNTFRCVSSVHPLLPSIESFLERIDEPLLVKLMPWTLPVRVIGYAGTFDMLATMKDGSYALLDWKTSYKEKPDYQLADYRMQLGAYTQAIEQMYDIEIEQAHCAISFTTPIKGRAKRLKL